MDPSLPATCSSRWPIRPFTITEMRISRDIFSEAKTPQVPERTAEFQTTSFQGYTSRSLAQRVIESSLRAPPGPRAPRMRHLTVATRYTARNRCCTAIELRRCHHRWRSEGLLDLPLGSPMPPQNPGHTNPNLRKISRLRLGHRQWAARSGDRPKQGRHTAPPRHHPKLTRFRRGRFPVSVQKQPVGRKPRTGFPTAAEAFHLRLRRR